MKKQSYPSLQVLLIAALVLMFLAACSDQPVVTQPPTTGDSSPLPTSNGSVLPTETAQKPTLEDIRTAWQLSAHANTFVKDEKGENSDCARCHAPVNWTPTIDDLPESCSVCKFEIKEAPKYIPEQTWESISCKVCHQSDKKGNLQPEIKWLEVAALDEYSTVADATALCMKCHAPENQREHVSIQLAGVHAAFQCIQCHNTHTLSASCANSACHTDVLAIPGHDADHRAVACVACHDAAGMEVGPGEDQATWQTFAVWTYTALGEQEQTSVIPFTSHNIQKSVTCERCHFEDNPWGLSSTLSLP